MNLNLTALPGLVAAPLFLAASLVVYLTRPDRRQNRVLALCFLGWALWAFGIGLLFAATDPASVYALALGFGIPVFLFHVSYALFLGTLPTPVGSWLSGRPARVLLWSVFAVLSLSLVAAPFAWQVAVVPGPGGALWRTTPGRMWIPFDIASMLLHGFGIVVAVSAYRRAKETLTRCQTGAYLAGFALFDATIIALNGAVLLRVPGQGEIVIGAWFMWGFFLAALWLMVALTYGVLSAQLFDIDIKVKWTIRRGTLVGIFVAVFFVVSETAAALLGDRWGTYGGILGAGLLLFALSPLQAFAERVADRALPHVGDTDAYIATRKEHVYRATLEEMIADGAFSLKERRVLLRLQEMLELDAATTHRLEKELLGRMG